MDKQDPVIKRKMDNKAPQNHPAKERKALFWTLGERLPRLDSQNHRLRIVRTKFPQRFGSPKSEQSYPLGPMNMTFRSALKWLARPQNLKLGLDV
eukprot:4527127-Amphidinium_carterae.1